MAIKIGILGYGNLGRGIECAIKQNDDVELAGVFTRRDPSTVKIMTEGVKVYSVDDAPKMKDENRCYDSLRRKCDRPSETNHRNMLSISML